MDIKELPTLEIKGEELNEIFREMIQKDISAMGIRSNKLTDNFGMVYKIELIIKITPEKEKSFSRN